MNGEIGTFARVKNVLSSRDFRQLVGLRLATQFGDGLFQAVLVGSVVFSPTKQSTPATSRRGTSSPAAAAVTDDCSRATTTNAARSGSRAGAMATAAAR